MVLEHLIALVAIFLLYALPILAQRKDQGLVEKGHPGHWIGSCHSRMDLDQEREEFAAAPVELRVDDLDRFLAPKTIVEEIF